ncbi:MAG: hypothetical protein LBC97_11095 [Bifidobacteriaceae bacterium]|jgi:hypothetical protein|nr:hypothetical protein [Bifidobacteriaceae bacterium]
MTVVVREAVATCRALLGRSLLLVATVVVLAGGSCLLDGTAAVRFHERYRQAVESGSEVLIVKDPEGETLSAGVCELIGRAKGVRAAGGIRFGNAVHAAQAPGVAIQTASASAGYFQVVAPAWASGDAGQVGVLVGAAVARDVGLRPGQDLATVENESFTVGRVADLSPRAPQQNRWIIWTGVHDQVDQCWIEAVVGAKDDVAALARSYYLPGNPRIQVASSAAHDARAALAGWETRLDRFAWAAGAALAAAMLAILWITRRGELALRRVLGFSRLDVALQLLVETLVVSAVALAVVIPWLALWATQADQPALIGFYSVRALIRFFGLLFAAAACLAVVFGGGDLAKRLRDR